MRNIIGLVLIGAMLILISGCPYGHKYEEGKFPSEPVNFSVVNSIFDDYNSTSPVIESEYYLYFSSNRKSYGGEFDIVGDHFHLLWDKDEGSLTINNQPSDWQDYQYTDSLFHRVNTSYNEFGPLSVPFYLYSDSGTVIYIDMIAFSNDEAGNQDLKISWFFGDGINIPPDEGVCEGPLPVVFLNGLSNDEYLAFYGPGFYWNENGVDPTRVSELIFCSDKSGNYDIYQTPVPGNIFLLDFLQKDTVVVINPVAILNSSHQDKCPYTNGDLLVFASDRPGGFGGFDLYYSIRNGSAWSEPVNFGDRINTAYDEYRPIVFQYYEFVNDLMIFSSNRPGGKGGFDLYYVGIPKMIP
jgi:hypothetical protein